MAEGSGETTAASGLPSGWIAAVRLIGALLLAYIYVVVLMTTTAQSATVAQLKDTEYSAAYARLTNADRAAAKYDPRVLAAAQAAATAADQAKAQAKDAFDDAFAPLAAAMTDLNAARLCGLGDPGAVRIGAVGATLDRVKACLGGTPGLPSELQGEMQAALDARPAIEKTARQYLDARVAADGAAATLATATAASATVQAQQDKAAPLRDAFAPVLVLQGKWLLGGGILVQLPPAMMQIVAAFFSGMFGALLLTLVLIVYPNVNLGIATPGGNYGERILLGGLIAICVLIVLGGGTAVLGTGNPFADGSANVHAFSAIGVLAGMFSDRVAQWLSKSATTFFGDRSGQGGGGGTPPAPPATPQLPAPPTEAVDG